MLISQNVVGVVVKLLYWMGQFAKEAGKGAPQVDGVAERDVALVVKVK